MLSVGKKNSHVTEILFSFPPINAHILRTFDHVSPGKDDDVRRRTRGSSDDRHVRNRQ